MIAQPPANIESIPARDHDVEEKQGRHVALGVRNQIDRSVKEAGLKPCCFKVMLHKTGNICLVFQNEYRLAQAGQPSAGGH